MDQPHHGHDFAELAEEHGLALKGGLSKMLAAADTVKANRQAAAAKARAAKDAKKTGTSPTELASELNAPADDPKQLFEPDTDPLAFPDAASMSPAEAKDAALALVRQAYLAGHVAAVKVLQKHWQVSKFNEVPTEKGHDFFSQALQLSQNVGLQP